MTTTGSSCCGARGLVVNTGYDEDAVGRTAGDLVRVPRVADCERRSRPRPWRPRTRAMQELPMPSDSVLAEARSRANL
ncbi:Hypothetical Protein FCC1311_032122 [Hondaea fermentalgiana]|uniref:Uncharacterized protein n=1 Tax=Hondaea fermentalgiana TaxID=2315210 RepID=A0A2R5G9K1_9STRA|nr:Hypothetical Protein FCC1311_032122 [Hondaea fermentalgiana]|eukprot:GBG26989.1 Hypothetical Protein FCC1311_032122 [Hondaea fermentalgiana]